MVYSPVAAIRASSRCRVLISITLNRGLQGDPVYIRGRPIKHITTPPEWTCPSGGRSGPLEVGEELPNDALACIGPEVSYFSRGLMNRTNCLPKSVVRRLISPEGENIPVRLALSIPAEPSSPAMSR